MTETPIAPGSPFDTLRQLHRWVGWRWEVRKNKKTKPPYSPRSGRHASVSDPSTWGSHDEALAMPSVDGIGIVITGHPNIAACDLDHCRDPATGTLAGWAQALIKQAGSYVEITPSHAGLRIVGLAQTGEQHFTIPRGSNGEKIEVYAGGASRFITVTEDVLVDRPLADITLIVELLMAERADAQAHGPDEDGEDLAGLSDEVAELILNGAPAGADRSVMLFFLPRFKLVFVGNTKPRIASVDEALVRRLNLVPFQFRPATRDEQLKEKLVIEYPAILRWAIDGWLDLKANGRSRPAVIASATKEYLDDENVIATWLAERCELGAPHETALKDLFADWKTWCETAGEDPETNRKLKRRLEKFPGLRFAHGMRGVIIRGVRLKS